MANDRVQLLITGASGQLAGRAAELVLEAHPPERLTLVSRNPEALAALAKRGVVVRFGDFAEPATLSVAFAGAERMLLVSATDLEHRVAQHRAAIDAAVAVGVGHLIYTSGLAPAPPNPAAVAPSHYATEQRLALAGIPFTVLRNSLYSDYQMAHASLAMEAGSFVHNWGEGRVAYVARDDCAAAAAAVLLAGGHEDAVYDITGPAAFSALELARLYGQLGGRPVEAIASDDAGFVASLVGDAGTDDHLKYGAELVASFGRSIREGYMASCTDSVAKLTGRAPRPLRDVLSSADL